MASANPCSDPSTVYDTGTIPVAATGAPGADPKGSFDHDFDCVQRVSEDLSCAPNIAYTPQTTAQGLLFFWLPGLDNRPEDNQHILHMAGYAGFDVLGISWDTQEASITRCVTECDLFPNTAGCSSPPPEPIVNACDETFDCLHIVHDEMWTGVDDPLTPAHDPGQGIFGYEGRYWSSIERRATRALQHLHEADVADTSVTERWSDYCEPDDTYGSRLLLDKVVVAGFSLGSSEAQHIYYEEAVAAAQDTGLPAPQGLWGTEMFGDYCDATLPVATSTSARPSPHYYTSWDNTWDTGTWEGGTLKTIDPGKTFVALHADSDKWPNQDHDREGYDGSPTDPDDQLPLAFEAFVEGDESDVFDYETDTGLGNDIVILRTTQASANTCGNGYSLHASMAGDDCLPDALSSGDKVEDPTDADELYLFEGYVSGMCAVGSIP